MEENKLLLTKETRKKQIAAYKEGRRGGYRISAEEINSYIARRSRS